MATNDETRETCDECGFDALDWSRDRALAELTEHAKAWRDAFAPHAPDALHQRPNPKVWSAVEYAVHTARIAEWWREAIATCAGGGKLVIDWNGYPDADVFPYSSVTPDDALADLEGELSTLRTSTEAFTDDHWQTPLRFEDAGVEAHFRSNGMGDLFTGVLHVIHDAHHHLGDIKKGLSSASD